MTHSQTDPKTLHVNGYIEDNCSWLRKGTNYPELQVKWTAFLNSVVTTGLEIDDEIIPVIDVEFVHPDICCDGASDVNCDNIIDSNNEISFDTVGGYFNGDQCFMMYSLTMVSLWHKTVVKNETV